MRDPEEIGRRLLRPALDAHRVAEVRGALRAIVQVDAAIEACVERGLMTDDRGAHPRRAAGCACSTCGGRCEDEAIDSGVSLGMWPCSTCGGRGYQDRAWTIELVTAVACDPTGIERAEELALEASRRMGPVGAAPRIAPRWSGLTRRGGVLWLETRGEPSWLGRYAWYWSMEWRMSAAATALRAKILSAARLEGGEHALAAAAQHAALELEWRWRASAGDQPFAAAAEQNPFTPVVDLWLSGYGLDGVTPAAVCLATMI